MKVSTGVTSIKGFLLILRELLYYLLKIYLSYKKLIDLNEIH